MIWKYPFCECMLNNIMRLFSLILMFSILVLAACTDEVSQASVIDSMRVLAIALDKPEASPGDMINAEVLVADPEGNGRRLNFAWLVCPLDYDSEAYECSSEGNSFFLPYFAENDPKASFFIPSDVLDSIPGSEEGPEQRTVSVGVFICAGGKLEIEAEELEQSCVGGDALFAYKRLIVSRNKKQNRNPEILEVTRRDEGSGKTGIKFFENGKNSVNGCNPDGECVVQNIRAALKSKLIEKYERTIFNETEEVDEEPFLAWFATSGEFRFNRSVDPVDEDEIVWQNYWKPPESGIVQMWVVVRDGRGGTDWTSFLITVK